MAELHITRIEFVYIRNLKIYLVLLFPCAQGLQSRYVEYVSIYVSSYTSVLCTVLCGAYTVLLQMLAVIIFRTPRHCGTAALRYIFVF